MYTPPYVANPGLTPQEQKAYDLLGDAFKAMRGLLPPSPELTDLLAMSMHFRALQDMIKGNVVARLDPSSHRLLGHDWEKELQ